MASLTCEICGGKLVGKPGGVFECDSCGMEYSTEWAKAKIQEIKGTVKVEGTVEVTGKVQIDGGTVHVEGNATKESLLKRAQICFSEGDAEKANRLFEQVLDADPECAEAYLYLAAIKVSQNNPSKHITSLENIHSDYITPSYENEWDLPEMRRAFQYSTGELKSVLEGWQCERNTAFSSFGAQLLEKSQAFEKRRSKITDVQNIISVGMSHIVALKADGTVVATGDNQDGQCDVQDWKGIKSICTGYRFTAGLRYDGTVIVTHGKASWNRFSLDVANWTDIISISAGSGYLIGLKSDGTAVATGDNKDHQCEVQNWKNLIAISTGIDHTVGLCADGTVVATGRSKDGNCNVAAMSDVVAISAGARSTAALRKDGTVLYVGYQPANLKTSLRFIGIYDGMLALTKEGIVVSLMNQPNPKKTWENIVGISNNAEAMVCANGTVIVRNFVPLFGGKADTSSWNDIVAVFDNLHTLVGLHENGTVSITGHEGATDGFGNITVTYDVSHWKLFSDAKTFKSEWNAFHEEQEALKRRHEEEEKEHQKEVELQRTELLNEKARLSDELGNLKGLFSGKRRKEINLRLSEIEDLLINMR